MPRFHATPHQLKGLEAFFANFVDKPEEIPAGALQMMEVILEGLPLGLLVSENVGEDGSIIYANGFARRLLGRSAANLYGRSLPEFLETPASLRGAFPADSDPRHDCLDLKLRFTRPADAGFWGLVRFMHLGKIAGGSPHTLLSLMDITEEVRQQERASKEKQLFESIVASSVAAITTLDNNGRIIFANEKAKDILGLEPSEVEGRVYNDPRFEHCYPDGSPFPEDQQPFLVVRRTKAPVQGIRQMIRWPDGNRKILSINGAPMLDEDGEVAFVTFQVADVTAEHIANASLDQQRRLLRDVFDTAPVIIWTSNLAKEWDFINDVGLKVTGCTFDQLAGKGWLRLLTPERRPFAEARTTEERLHQFYNNDPTVVYEAQAQVRIADGSFRWFLERSTMRVDQEGKPIGLIGCLIDIHERKLAADREKRLLIEVTESRKLEHVGLLAAGLVHNFTNTLTAIVGYTDLALLSLEEDSEAAESLLQISDTVQSANGLCQQLLAYARQQAAVPVAVSPKKMVSQWMPLFRAAIPARVTLAVRLEDVEGVVRANPIHFQQALLNLIINASDAIGESSGHVRVYGREEDPNQLKEGFGPPALVREEEKRAGRFFFLTVTDDGCGMPPETAKRVLDPFYTTKKGGRGIGLTTVLGFVQELEGALYVWSTPGEGTTFGLALPLENPATADPLSSGGA